MFAGADSQNLGVTILFFNLYRNFKFSSNNLKRHYFDGTITMQFTDETIQIDQHIQEQIRNLCLMTPANNLPDMAACEQFSSILKSNPIDLGQIDPN